jgi:hypothetical protein
MKTKTAIDWFEQELDKLDIQIPFSIFEEAKEMFKDQIENAYIQGFCECNAIGIMDVDKYYNKNYGN